MRISRPQSWGFRPFLEPGRCDPNNPARVRATVAERGFPRGRTRAFFSIEEGLPAGGAFGKRDRLVLVREPGASPRMLGPRTLTPSVRRWTKSVPTTELLGSAQGRCEVQPKKATTQRPLINHTDATLPATWSWQKTGPALIPGKRLVAHSRSRHRAEHWNGVHAPDTHNVTQGARLVWHRFLSPTPGRLCPRIQGTQYPAHTWVRTLLPRRAAFPEAASSCSTTSREARGLHTMKAGHEYISTPIFNRCFPAVTLRSYRELCRWGCTNSSFRPGNGQCRRSLTTAAGPGFVFRLRHHLRCVPIYR